MVSCNHDIVRVVSVLSHRRKYYGQQHKRASLAPRSDPPPLGRRESRRDLPRFGSLAALVRQVVGRVSAKPSHRLCLPLALSAPLAPAAARRRRNPELSYYRSLLARGLLDAASGQDQPHMLRPSAENLGILGAARDAAVRQRRRLLWRTHPPTCAWSGRAHLSVLWGRAAVHALLRTQAQLSDRKLSQSLGEQLLVAARVHHDLRGRSRDGALQALVYVPILSTRTLGADHSAGATRCERAPTERSLAQLDPTGALAADGGTDPLPAQSRPQRCDRNTERSLASRLQVEW